MRAVSSATWTSGEPVSFWARWNLATMSPFLMSAIDMISLYEELADAEGRPRRGRICGKTRSISERRSLLNVSPRVPLRARLHGASGRPQPNRAAPDSTQFGHLPSDYGASDVCGFKRSTPLNILFSALM